MMNGRIRTVLLTAVALSLTMPLAAGASGPPGPDKDRANKLRAMAEALYDQPNEWRKAAKLLEKSADLRTADDPAAYDCLLYAGRIRASMGDFSAAKGLLERAAEQALARGAVMDAARAYVDAAFAAKAGLNGTAAVAMIEKARLLTNSPLLSPDQKVALLDRID